MIGTMPPREAELRQSWERTAPGWTKLARAGYDVCRDRQTSPAFFEMLPRVEGLDGLDIGCGEGHNTRLLASRGARVTAVDLAENFILAAACHPDAFDIRHALANCLTLPFAARSFDFATAFMSLMDVGAPEAALAEIARVLRPGGFLQFSILHPCFCPPHRKLVRDATGAPRAVEVGRYFERLDGEVERWIFSAAPSDATAGLPPFEIPRFHRTLADWLNAIAAPGFGIERCVEPIADSETASRVRGLADTRVVPNFLLIRCRLGA